MKIRAHETLRLGRYPDTYHVQRGETIEVDDTTGQNLVTREVATKVSGGTGRRGDPATGEGADT